MIDAKCFTTEWIEQKSKELNCPDKNIIEKVIRAFSLLDMLASSRCPFYFKGGSCLMLILQGGAHRLSIDIDILCSPGTNIEDYLKQYAENGFLEYKLIERKQSVNNIPKSHTKLFYQVEYLADSDKKSYILLDVVYDECHYKQTQKILIDNVMIECVGERHPVVVPSISDILGDKLTAFAPETTGIPYFKKDKLATLEIIKQLYDIGRLFDKVDDLVISSSVFKELVPVELGYRGLSLTISDVCEDIRQTALNISTRGYVDGEKFKLLQQGIKSISSFIFSGAYRIENAIIDAAKAAYLATAIENEEKVLQHYNGSPLSVADMQITHLPSRLNRLKIGNPEAFFYWAKTDTLFNAICSKLVNS